MDGDCSRLGSDNQPQYRLSFGFWCTPTNGLPLLFQFQARCNPRSYTTKVTRSSILSLSEFKLYLRPSGHFIMRQRTVSLYNDISPSTHSSRLQLHKYPWTLCDTVGSGRLLRPSSAKPSPGPDASSESDPLRPSEPPGTPHRQSPTSAPEMQLRNVSTCIIRGRGTYCAGSVCSSWSRS